MLISFVVFRTDSVDSGSLVKFRENFVAEFKSIVFRTLYKNINGVAFFSPLLFRVVFISRAIVVLF